MQHRILNTQGFQRFLFRTCTLKGRLIPFISRYQYYFIILAVFYLGFLLITPLGRFNPGVPTARTYSLTKIDRYDDTAYYMIAKSIIVDGDLDYSDEQLNPKVFYNLTSKGNPIQGGRIPIGSSILWSPFILIAHILTKLFNILCDVELSENGYSSIYLMIATIGSSIYTFLSLLLSFKILKRFFSPNISLLSVLTVFWGNSLFYNTYVRMLMSHSPEVFTIALYIFFYIILVDRGKLVDYLLFGFSCGLMVIVRYDNTMFLIMPLFHVLFSFWSCLKWRQWHPLNVKLRNYCLAVLALFMVVLPQFLHFYIQTGTFIPSGLEASLSQTFTKMISVKELLFSETRNILWGKPIVTIGAIGSVLFIRQNRLLGLSLSLVILFGISWLFWRPHAFWWGMDFGIRHLIKLSLPLAFGYAALIKSVNMKGKTAFFSAFSLAIVLWEYLKIIQTPKITPILTEGFLRKAALQIPDLVSKSLPDVLLGTECSYFRVLTTYGLSLEKFNIFDWINLVILPLYVLALCLFLLRMFVFFEERRSNDGIISEMAVGACIIFFGCLSLLGFTYPEKRPEKMYNDFKNGGIVAFDKGEYVQSAKCFRQALSIRGDGDVVEGFLCLIDRGISFPYVFSCPETEKILSLAARDSNTVIRSAGRRLLNKVKAAKVAEKGYYDFGTATVRNFLKRGWSGNEGPHPQWGYPTLVWAVGTQSELDIYSKSAQFNKRLIFRAKSFIPDQSVNILLNEMNIGTIEIDPDWKVYEVLISGNHLKPGKNRLVFIFAHAKAPSESGGKDTRKLAMAFDWLRIEDDLQLKGEVQ